MSDYLWDKSGKPDPEIERLEKLLTPLALPPGRSKLRRRIWIPIAIAASVAAIWMFPTQTVPGWQIQTLAGNPTVKRWHTIQTDSQSRARLNLPDVGEVEMEPDTSLRVLTVHTDNQRLELNRGTIHAQIWAPPGQFYVNTPSAVTVDLGCAYTLRVDEHGVGLVQVTLGWVAFESSGRESFIPAAAACETRPGKGPGVPYYEDASSALRKAVQEYDRSAGSGQVVTILAQARTRDAITLWHLLRRVPPAERGAVYDRMAALIRIPPGVSRDGVLSGNAGMLDSLWNSLDLGDTSWWRMWKSRTPSS